MRGSSRPSPEGRIAPPQRTPLARPPRLEAPQEGVPFVVVRKVALTLGNAEVRIADQYVLAARCTMHSVRRVLSTSETLLVYPTQASNVASMH